MKRTVNTNPLRKIVGMDGILRDVLECGHTMSQAKDIYGDRFPERRRCRKCALGRPIEFVQNEGGNWVRVKPK